jgi:hypothetical protein
VFLIDEHVSRLLDSNPHEVRNSVNGNAFGAEKASLWIPDALLDFMRQC